MTDYLILFGAMVALFYKAFYCGYVVDDVQMAAYMNDLKKEVKEKNTGWLNFFKVGFYGAGWFGNAKQEYAFTLAIHYINCCLICHMTGSLMAALLYLVNPINNQTALWMNGRRYALTILAVLLVWNWKFLAVLLFPFLFWVHISGVVAPLLFLATPYWWTVPIAALVGVYVFKKNLWNHFRSRQSEFKQGNENQNITWRKLILYVKSVGYNAFNCVLPFKPAMYHNFLFYFSNSPKDNEEGYRLNYDFWKGVPILAFLIYMIAVQHNFWAFWFLLFISPWCNIYQITMNAADRYCSLANVGMMIMLAGLISQLPQPYSTAIFTGLIVLYVVKYQPLFRAYTSIENFYLYHLYQQPDLVNPRYFLAKFYIQNNDVYSAFVLIKKGLRFRPNDFRFLLCMMECMFALGKVEAGLKVMALVEKNVPYLEVEDCKEFFDGLKNQYKKEIARFGLKEKLTKRNVHNNGQPIVNAYA